jgi:non-ribosomal peptide synthetase component F
MRGTLEYSLDLFDRSIAQTITTRLIRLLHAIPIHPADPISTIDILGPDERHQLLTSFKSTRMSEADMESPEADLPQVTLVSLFEEQVVSAPAATALVFQDTAVSYAELNTRANRLAHLLLAHGASPEQVVAVALPPSVELVVALLAVLKTGAAYLPIDVNYPAERITFILGDASPSSVVSTVQIAAGLTAGPCASDEAGWVVLDAPDTVTALADCPERDPDDADRAGVLDPLNPAYVIYTSGSTGTPKGVLVSHSMTTSSTSAGTPCSPSGWQPG